MTFQVDDTRPAALANQYTDDSQVEKFEMDDETYAKRTGECFSQIKQFSKSTVSLKDLSRRRRGS